MTKFLVLKLLALTAALCALVLVFSLNFVPMHRDWGDILSGRCPIVGVCNLP